MLKIGTTDNHLCRLASFIVNFVSANNLDHIQNAGYNQFHQMDLM